MDRLLCRRRRSDEQQPPNEEEINIEQLQEKERSKKQEKLFEAIQGYDIIKIKELIDNGINIQEAREGPGKKTVIHCLADMECETGKETKLKEMFDFFMSYNACLLDETDYFGNTAAMLAAEKGNIPILKLLLEKGADIKKGDRLSGDTPLHWAAKEGMLEAVHILITRGDAHVMDIQNKLHKTPLHLAVEKNKKNVVLLLLYHNANRNLKDNVDEPPIRYAERNHLSEIVKLLKKPLDEFKKTELLEYAKKNNFPEIVKLFQDPSSSQADGQGEYVTPDFGGGKVTNIFNVTANDQSQVVVGPNSSMNIIRQSSETNQEAHQSPASSTSDIPLSPQEPESNSSPYSTDPTPSAPQELEKDLSPYSLPIHSAVPENN